MIRIGDKVTIYEDPMTKLHSEGQAVLRELLRNRGDFTDWRVEFDELPREFYERTIYGEDTDEEASER